MFQILQEEHTVRTRGRGHIEVTGVLEDVARRSGVTTGQLCVFCRHTSCSLIIMENADPSAWADLERYMDRLAPENDPDYTHTLEGADDMPGHLRMALTRTSETIPVQRGALVLGTWQGVYLWEHRRAAHARRLFVSVLGEGEV